MKNTILIILLSIPLSCFAQSNYPKPDCPSKVSKALVLYPNEYKNDPEIPIIRTESGFRYKNLIFNSEDDAFMLLSPERCTISGNSKAIVDKVSNYTVPNYPITIIKNGDFMMFIGDTFEIDLEKIKKEDYHFKSSKFFDVQVSNAISNPDSLLNLLDAFTEEFCDSAYIDLPENRIRCYIHSNPNTARLFTNEWLDCKDYDSDYVFGTVKFDIIHTVGSDFSFISHETIHAIWNVANKPQNFFLSEGAAVYFSFFQNYSRNYINTSILENIRQQFEETVKSSFQSDFQKLITDKNAFWINPGLSYAFAGLFSEYLIKNYRLEKFKEIFGRYENEGSFEIVYNKNLSQLINEFKEYIVR